MKTWLVAFALTTSSAFACGYGSTYDRLECTLTAGGRTDSATLDLDHGGDIAGLEIPGVVRANLQATVEHDGQVRLVTVAMDYSRGLPIQGDGFFSVPQQCDVPRSALRISKNVRDAANRTVAMTLNCDVTRHSDRD